MAQFCYLRLYFGVDIVSRRLLQFIARIENGLKEGSRRVLSVEAVGRGG